MPQPLPFETKLFPLVEEFFFAQNSKELELAQLLNSGLTVINGFLRYNLKKEAEKYHSLFQFSKNEVDLQRTKVAYLAARHNIENRETLLKYYIDKKAKIPELKYDSRFAFFQAKDLVAIADMLDIVLERMQKEMSVVPESAHKHILDKKLKGLKETRQEIIGCMKAHLTLADQNSQQRKVDQDMEISFMDIQTPNHSLISLAALPQDTSLFDEEFTPHPMRLEFKRKTDPVFKVNEIFCLQYIFKHGTEEDKDWLNKTKGPQYLTLHISWLSWYTAQFYALLPDPKTNAYAGLALDGYNAIKPIGQYIYNELFDWGKIIVDISGVKELITNLEQNENFQQIKADISDRVTEFHEYISSLSIPNVSDFLTAPKLGPSHSTPNLHNSVLDNNWVNLEKNDEFHRSESAPNNLQQHEIVSISKEKEIEDLRPKKPEAVEEAEKKYTKYHAAFTSLNLSLKKYLEKIENTQGCGAVSQFFKDKDGIDFIKNFFMTRKLNPRKNSIEQLQAFMFSDDMKNFRNESDDKKVELMKNIETKIRDLINKEIKNINKENNHYPSELKKILNDALTNQTYPWHVEEHAEENNDTQQLLMTSKK